MFKKLVPFAFVAFAMASATGAASAQTALANGVSLTTGTQSQTTFNSIDLGTSPGTSTLSRMPMSLSYAGTNLNISFNATSGVVGSENIYNPTPGSNFISAGGTNGATFTFSAVQQYFGFQWGTPNDGNNVQFYNGQTLLASVSGSEFRTAGNVAHTYTGSSAGFSFSELGFDKVVMSSLATEGGFEAGALRFSDTVDAVDVAPIPLNAASLGGLMSFLMMLAMRGKGGTQVMVRMAFASIMPRRRMAA